MAFTYFCCLFKSIGFGKGYLMTYQAQAIQEYRFYVDLMRRRDHWEN